MLQASRNVVEPAVLSEIRAGLLEMEGNARALALPANIQNPLIIADSGVFAGFPSDRDAPNGRGKIGRKINGREQRLTDDFLMCDGSLFKNWESHLCHFVVFHRTADGDVVIAIPPILRDTGGKT